MSGCSVYSHPSTIKGPPAPEEKQQKHYSKHVFEDVTLGCEKMYFTIFYTINWLMEKLISKVMSSENYKSGFYFSISHPATDSLLD